MQFTPYPEARRLSETEKQQYKRDGYVKNLPAFSPESA